MSEDTLDDVISGTDAPVAEVTPDVKPEVAEPVSEPVAEPVAEPTGSSPDVIKELMGKQDAIFAELGRVREQNRLLKAEKEEPAEKTNIWEDPEKRLDEVKSEFDAKLRGVIEEQSEMYARRTHSDFDAKLDVFIEMVKTNDLLRLQMNKSRDPAEFAYKTASEKLIYDEIGNIHNFKSAVEKAADEKADAKYKKLYEEQLGQSLPTSLADTRAAADNTSFVNETLGDVIGEDAIHRK